MFRNQQFRKKRKSLTTIKFSARAHSQVAIYTVFHAESESAVRNLEKIAGKPKFLENQKFIENLLKPITQIKVFRTFWFLNILAFQRF